ncbi:MAG: hypothetical protein IPF82_21290 [Blastocatellia bacterium]|nr:hypothetical protein [Blastocatellia bacterium]
MNDHAILVLTFRIDESLKGPSAGTVEVVTDSSDTSCYAGFEKGRRYLIYTQTWTKVPDPGSGDEAMPTSILERVQATNKLLPDLATGLCTRSGPLDARQDELEIIRSLKDGRIETRIYGAVRRREWNFETGYHGMKDAGPMGGVLVTATGPGGRSRLRLTARALSIREPCQRRILDRPGVHKSLFAVAFHPGRRNAGVRGRERIFLDVDEWSNRGSPLRKRQVCGQ